MGNLVEDLAEEGQRLTDAFGAWRRATSVLDRERARLEALLRLDGITLLAEVLRGTEPDAPTQRLVRDWLAMVERTRRELNRGTTAS